MEMVKKLLKSKYIHLCGAFSFVLYALSFLIGHEEESSNHILILVKIALVTASAVLYMISCSNAANEKIKILFSFLSIAVLIWHIMLILSTGKTVLYIRDYPSIISCIMWLVCSAVPVILFRNSLKTYFLSITKSKDTVVLAAIAALSAATVIILSAEPSGIMFTWDSDTLYRFIYARDYDALYDAKQLLFDNHISIVYMYLLILFKLLFGNIRIAFFVLNMLCIITASFGMTFLIRKLIPGRKNIAYILADIIFMLSPWVCGMSTYHIYDYYIWCLFPLMICFYAQNNQIGFFVFGAMISFSRSPGLIIFGSLCAVTVVKDVIAKRSLIPVLKNTKYYYYISVALVFFVYFLFGIDESMKFNDTVLDLKRII